MTVWAVVPAAGGGSRLGAGIPKQYLLIAGKHMLSWSVEALLACERVAGCMVALAADDAHGPALFDDPRVRFCVGGATRAESVTAGLEALDANRDDWVLVHDAARPCVLPECIDRLIDKVLDSGDGGLLAQRQADTLKRADATGRVLETLSREGVWRAQTPQMFRVGELMEALEAARGDGLEVTDEASAVEHLGRPVQVVEGAGSNLKVTFADDVLVAKQWLRARAELAPVQKKNDSGLGEDAL